MPVNNLSNLCNPKRAPHLSSSKFNDAELEVEWKKFEINYNKKYMWLIIIVRFIICLLFDKTGFDVDETKLVKNTDKTMF